MALNFDWFRRRKVQVSIRPSTSLRLEEWRRSSGLVGAAAQLLHQPLLKSMLDVLRTESPANSELPLVGVPADDRAAYSAFTAGYHRCLNNFEALGDPLQEVQPIEATFEEELSAVTNRR